MERGGAKPHGQSALPRETYYNRSRWSFLFPSLLKFFGKGSLRGRTFFPLLNFSKKGASLLATESFFKSDVVRPIILTQSSRSSQSFKDCFAFSAFFPAKKSMDSHSRSERGFGWRHRLSAGQNGFGGRRRPRTSGAERLFSLLRFLVASAARRSASRSRWSLA